MKYLLIFLVSLLAFATADGAGPSAAEFTVFSPAKNAYAKKLVAGPVKTVERLDAIDPQVLRLFHAKVPRREISDRGGRFEATDVISDTSIPMRRLVFAGQGPGVWFILYEHGGIGYHHNLVVFGQRADGLWRIVAAPQGSVGRSAKLADLRASLKKGTFIEQPGYSFY